MDDNLILTSGCFSEHSIGLTQIIGHMDSVDRSFIFFSRISIISFGVN